MDLSLPALGRAYAAGGFTPRKLIHAVIARADAFASHNIWIERAGAELIECQLSRLERDDNAAALPLYGVPFVVKDNIDAAGLPTTAACAAFSYLPERSATVVKKLTDAGAVYLGKTNLDQFATGLVGTRSPYGACKNAFDPAYISGGSSSGSAVAVALGLASFSLGTDTAGSGRIPAAFNNLVGLKPTRGRLSCTGVVPACRSLDCVSIFALTCQDAAAVLAAAEGFDETDAYSRKVINAPGAAKIIGVIPRGQRVFFDAETEASYDEAIARVESLGFQTVEIDFDPFARTAKLLYEGPWVAERLVATKALLESQPDALYPVTRKIISGGLKVDALSTFQGLYRLEELRRLAAKQWERMDVLLTPTAPTIYTIEQVDNDPIRLNSNLGTYTNYVNLLDLSGIAVPHGFYKNGLPIGVTFLAPAWRDLELCAVGARYQGATKNLSLGAAGRTAS